MPRDDKDCPESLLHISTGFSRKSRSFSSWPYLRDITITRLVCHLVCPSYKNSWGLNFSLQYDRISGCSSGLHEKCAKTVYRATETVGNTPDRERVTDGDSRWHDEYHQKSWVSWDTSKSAFCHIGQYLEFGDTWGLYVGLRELSCATRRKLVDI